MALTTQASGVMVGGTAGLYDDATSGTWFYSLWVGIRAGNFPLETVQLTALSLVPGLSLLLASIWSADVVRRRLRKSPAAA